MGIPPQGKRARNRQRWFERICAWERSDLSQRAFIERHCLNGASFYRWKRIYRSEGAEGTGASASGMLANAGAGLVPVEVLEQSHPGDCGVMLELDGTMRIRLEPAFDAATLERVLRLLAKPGVWR